MTSFRFSFFICLSLLCASSYGASIRYRGIYKGSSIEYRTDVYLDQINDTRPPAQGPYLAKMRLEVVICLGEEPQRKRVLELASLDPLAEQATFKVIGSSNPADLELTYTSKWDSLDGSFITSDGLGTIRPHLTVKRLKSDVATCADAPEIADAKN